MPSEPMTDERAAEIRKRLEEASAGICRSCSFGKLGDDCDGRDDYNAKLSSPRACLVEKEAVRVVASNAEVDLDALLDERARLKRQIAGGNMVISELKEDVAHMRRVELDAQVDADRLKAHNASLQSKAMGARIEAKGLARSLDLTAESRERLQKENNELKAEVERLKVLLDSPVL